VRGKLEPVTFYEVFETEAPEAVVLKRKSRFEFEKAVSLYREGKREEARLLFDQIIKENPTDLPALYFRSEKG
jgi:hypothetical protein